MEGTETRSSCLNVVPFRAAFSSSNPCHLRTPGLGAWPAVGILLRLPSTPQLHFWVLRALPRGQARSLLVAALGREGLGLGTAELCTTQVIGMDLLAQYSDSEGEDPRLMPAPLLCCISCLLRTQQNQETCRRPKQRPRPLARCTMLRQSQAKYGHRP